MKNTLIALAVYSLIALCPLTSLGQSKHPVPSDKVIPFPMDAVNLYELPRQKIAFDGIEIYKNTPPDISNSPFEVFISPSAFTNLVNTLKKEGVFQGERVRFVYHFPGDISRGAHFAGPHYEVQIVLLSMGVPTYRHVYLPYFKDVDMAKPEAKERFVAMASDQMNLVLWHEVEHIRHAREKWPQDKADEDAIQKEHTRKASLPPVFFLKLSPNSDLKGSLQYAERLLQTP